MSIPKILGIDRIEQWPRSKSEAWLREKKPAESKITVFVLDRLGCSNSYGRATVLPERFASRAMMDVLSSIAAPIRNRGQDKIRIQIKRKRSKTIDLLIPIGLRLGSSFQWVNAWIQFLIHLPKFTELVSFVGKSFEPFRVFVDQYVADQKEGKYVSAADSSSLVSCLLRVYPTFLSKFSQRTDLCQVFRFLFKSIFFPMALDVNAIFYDSIIFHPDWMMVWDKKSSFSYNDQLQNILTSRPSEMMVAFKQDSHFTQSMIQRQLFPSKGRCFYDLDAFIECRPEANGAYFVTYVRIEGAWYQCDDEKVRCVSSRTLSVPLSRGILFHYIKKRPRENMCSSGPFIR